MLSCLVPRFGQEDMPSSTKFDLQCKEPISVEFQFIILCSVWLSFLDVSLHLRVVQFPRKFQLKDKREKSLKNILRKVVVKNGRKQFFKMFVALSASYTFRVSFIILHFSMKKMKLCTHSFVRSFLPTHLNSDKRCGKNVIVSIEKPDRDAQWGISLRWSFAGLALSDSQSVSEVTVHKSHDFACVYKKLFKLKPGWNNDDDKEAKKCNI